MILINMQACYYKRRFFWLKDELCLRTDNGINRIDLQHEGGDFMYRASRIRFHIITFILILFLVNFNVYIFLDAADKLQIQLLSATAESTEVEVAQFDSMSQELNAAEQLTAEQLSNPADHQSGILMEAETGSDSGINLEFGASVDEIIVNDLHDSMSEIMEENVKHSSEPQLSMGTYRVCKGDSLYWIAKRYDTTIHRLKELNNLTTEIIHADQVLIVPADTLKEYPVGVSLTDKEVKWIAQMIHAEARGEPYIGQVAVGAVIINRLKSRKFPNTVYEVLFQENAFQPIRNGTFFTTASDQAYRAALEALNGNDPTNGALYFFNPKISNNKFMHTRTTSITIGQHRFAY